MLDVSLHLQPGKLSTVLWQARLTRWKLLEPSKVSRIYLLFSFNCCAKGNIDQWRGESGSSFIERGGTPVRPLIIVMEIILYFSTLDNYCVGQAEIINRTSSHQM